MTEYNVDLRRDVIRCARVKGRRLAAHEFDVDVSIVREWLREDDLERAMPTAREERLLARDDLGPRDLTALANISSRALAYLNDWPEDDGDLSSF